MKQNGADVYGSDRILPRRYDLLRTDKCSTNREMLQLDRTRIDGSEDAEYLYELYDNEDFSLPPSDGHCSDCLTDPPESQMSEDGFPSYEESTAYVACASDSEEQPVVLHECLAVTALNPASNKSCRAVVMFGSGSSSSHVSTKLAHLLNLPHGETRVQNVSIFGSKTLMALDGFRTFLVLCSEHGRCLQVNVTVTDCIVSSVRTAFIRDADLPALRRNDCLPTPTREVPDLLIGQDLIHLFNRQLEPTLPTGFYIVQTSMGPTIAGAPRSATPILKATTTSCSPTAVSAAGDADIAVDYSRCPPLPSPSMHEPSIGRIHLLPQDLLAYLPAYSAGGAADSFLDLLVYLPAYSAGNTVDCVNIECLEPSTTTSFFSRQSSSLTLESGFSPRSSQKQLLANPQDAQLLLLLTYSTTNVDVEEVSVAYLATETPRPIQEPRSSAKAHLHCSMPPPPTRTNLICTSLDDARIPRQRKTRLKLCLLERPRQLLGIYTATEPVIAVGLLLTSDAMSASLSRAMRLRQLELMPLPPRTLDNAQQRIPWTDDSCDAVFVFDRHCTTAVATEILVRELKLPADSTPTYDFPAVTGAYEADLLTEDALKLSENHLATGPLPELVRTVLVDEKLLAAVRRNKKPPDVVPVQPHLLIGMDLMTHVQYRNGSCTQGSLHSVSTRPGATIEGSLQTDSDSPTKAPTPTPSDSTSNTAPQADDVRNPVLPGRQATPSDSGPSLSRLHLWLQDVTADPSAYSAGGTTADVQENHADLPA
ncbi:Pao retrotransposon peptidase family protein [Aphelenchoides avenae]|nr:Pao retrotransposon peptidase family protein [Aphelenchus avenae]